VINGFVENRTLPTLFHALVSKLGEETSKLDKSVEFDPYIMKNQLIVLFEKTLHVQGVAGHPG
jgi:hypothetical protein